MLESRDIQNIIPHRPPFLLVDRILELEPGVRATGIKNVSANEGYLQGHFPGMPIMPGVLIVEALAQVGSVALLSLPENQGKVGLFAGIDGFRFRRPVLPGDTLRLEVSIIQRRGLLGKGQARAEVDGQLVAEGILLFAIAAREEIKR